MKIFLSHTHNDRTIAKALVDLIHACFDDVVVDHSSAQGQGEGIPPGVPWLQWIHDHITQADKTYVLLTPNSIDRPWVLWEAGAAAGVALATEKAKPVVPITYRIPDEDIPSPLAADQCVHGDRGDAGGVRRLLQDLNADLGSLLSGLELESEMGKWVPDYLDMVEKSLDEAIPAGRLLERLNAGFDVHTLEGVWATAYDFVSGGTHQRSHADVARVAARDGRRIVARNDRTVARTEGRAMPFLNHIEAELVNRQLIGHWRNVNDESYFGAIHMTVLTGENVMEGHYTTVSSTYAAEHGRWRWVRLDPTSMQGVDLTATALREAPQIRDLVFGYDKNAGPLQLDAIVEDD